MMTGTYLDQQEKVIISRETITEYKVKYTHRRFVVPIADVDHCVRDMTNDGSLSLK